MPSSSSSSSAAAMAAGDGVAANGGFPALGGLCSHLEGLQEIFWGVCNPLGGSAAF